VVIIALCFLIGLFFYSELKPKDVPVILKEAFRSTAAIMLMILGAVVFGCTSVGHGFPQNITEWMLSFTNSPISIYDNGQHPAAYFRNVFGRNAMLMIMTPLLFLWHRPLILMPSSLVS
jgi:TRAP-type C4-dicarboxylate transport system permease large subunit